jgi:hypothetical protein
MKNKPDIRKFESGAVRDTSSSKYDYYGFREPRTEQIFAWYMDKHRKLPDGSVRDANNWWKGWSKDISLQSLVRHVEDLQAIHAGYVVIEIRGKDGVRKVYHDLSNNEPYIIEEDEDAKVISIEECCSAIRFNSMAYLLKHIK